MCADVSNRRHSEDCIQIDYWQKSGTQVLRERYSQLDNFDSNVAVSSVSVKHKDIDQEKIINELVTTAKVFEEHEGRFHYFFPNFRPLFSQVKKRRFENWITSHVNSWKYCQNR